jgi:hypothetical protein
LPEDIEQGQITVTDLDGRTVAVLDVAGNIGNVVWDIKTVKEGVYLYSLVAENKTLITKRLVIVH